VDGLSDLPHFIRQVAPEIDRLKSASRNC